MSLIADAIMNLKQCKCGCSNSTTTATPTDCPDCTDPNDFDWSEIPEAFDDAEADTLGVAINMPYKLKRVNAYDGVEWSVRIRQS